MSVNPPPDTPGWRRTKELRAKRAQRAPLLSFILPPATRISDEGFTALDEHKYKPGPYTPLDLFLYRTWWKPFSEYLPMWLAPNMLTLMGCAAVVISAVVLVVISPDLDNVTPAWAEVLAAFLILFYQTCDAVDGLQARRTGASSPLGELLDHGCDGVCLSAITVGTCVAARYGLTPLMLNALVASWIPWWVAQWEAYHTGIVRTGSEVFGVTEIQFIIAGIHLVTAIFGGDLWGVTLIGNYEFRFLCVLAQLIVSGVLSVENVVVVVKHARSQQELVAAAKRAMPLVILCGVTCAWGPLVGKLHVRAVAGATCAIFTRIASEIVVAEMTKEPYPRAQPTVALLPVFLVLGALGALSGTLGGALIWAYVAYCVVDACAYVVDILIEISNHLGVSLFFITKKVE